MYAAALASLLVVGTVASPPSYSVWPMPQVMNLGSTVLPLDVNFNLNCVGAICPDPISSAMSRYLQIILLDGPPASSPGPTVTGVDITIAADAPLALGVSENYTISIASGGGRATISADTQWGALRALETFSQLVAWEYAGNGTSSYSILGAPVSIEDFPRFQWRGILIDSSRHFLTVAAVQTVLDAMSYNKMNRLHWHIVDDNSWPLASTTYPNFTAGAYVPSAVYNHADITAVVQYAFERGISVVPEFDSPAHATAWGFGYPELVISCADGQTLVDPTDTGLFYTYLEGLMEEFVPLFKTDFFHFGGDEEENFNCWAESPEVQAFATRQGFGSNMTLVRNYFESRLQTLAAKYNLSPMFWEEVYDKGYTLSEDAIIDVWLSDDELISIIQSGRRVVESYGLYLDQQTPAGDTHYFWVDTFLNFYLHDPLYNVSGVTPEQAALVLGLSASQWGEQVDSGNIQSRMWPRACASAERMWSDMNLRDTNAVFPRIEAQRCRMYQRGIGAGPVRPADQVGYCSLPSWSRFAKTHNPWSQEAGKEEL